MRAKPCIRCCALLARRGSLVANTDHNPTRAATFARVPSDRIKRKKESAFNLNSLALSHREASTPARQLPKRDTSHRRSTSAPSTLSRFQIRERQLHLRDRFLSLGEISVLTVEGVSDFRSGLPRQKPAP